MNLRRLLVPPFVQLLWPARCAGCDVRLPSDEVVFCGACAQSINPMGLACAGCALPQLGPSDICLRLPCSGCARRHFAFSRAFAGFEYGAALATAIIRMKHGKRPDLARRLGRLLSASLARALRPGGADSPIDAVLPVPLHPRKLRRRGFNQALALARVALTQLEQRSPAAERTPVGRLPPLERRLLLRVRHTRELGRAPPDARTLEVFGAFGVSDRARVEGRRFLVVDDVMTTGATLNECAETLLRAGAEEVRVMALARAV